MAERIILETAISQENGVTNKCATFQRAKILGLNSDDTIYKSVSYSTSDNLRLVTSPTYLRFVSASQLSGKGYPSNPFVVETDNAYIVFQLSQITTLAVDSCHQQLVK